MVLHGILATPAKRVFLFLTSISLSLITYSSHAHDQTLRIGLSDVGYPPYLMSEKEGLYGIVGDTFIKVSNTLNLKTEVVVLPKKRITLGIGNGTIDAIAAAVEWEKKTPPVIWTDGIISVSDNVIRVQGQGLDIKHPTQLAGKHVALMNGYRYPSLEKMLDGKKISDVRAYTFKSLLNLVVKNRVDYGVIDQNVAKWVIREQNLKLPNALKFISPGFDEVEFRIVFYSNKWAPFIKKFNRALKKFKTTDEWQTILDKYR